MKRHHLHTIGHLPRHAPEHLLETHKRLVLRIKDVGLVHLIREKEDPLIETQLDDLLDRVPIQARPRGISRVDDDQRFDGGLGFSRFGDGVDKDGVIEGPVIGFLKIVRERRGGDVGEGGGVERILRDRDHHPVPLA